MIVALDQDLVSSALEIMFPFVTCPDYWQELPIVGVIGLFGGRAILSVEIDQANNPESVALVEYAGDWDAACIGLQNDQVLQVKKLEDECLGKGHLKRMKSEFGIPSPLPLP